MDRGLTYPCPTCGSEVRVGQPCPGCAPRSPKRRRTPKPKPWEQHESADGLDLPDEDFDYDEFVEREFGRAPHRRLGVAWWWWLLGIVALAAMIVGVLR